MINTGNTGVRRSSGLRAFLRVSLNQWQMYVMVLLPVTFLLIFCYGPIFGVIMAFKDFSIRKGVWGSPWVGFKYFEQFLTSPVFKQLLGNTLSLSFYAMVAEFFFPILLALGLNEVSKAYFKKSVQMITYFPYFISTVVLVGMLLQMLSPTGGLVNNIRALFGQQALNFMGTPKWWRGIYVWSGVWQSSGYRAVLYIAALTAVDPTGNWAGWSGSGRFWPSLQPFSASAAYSGSLIRAS